MFELAQTWGLTIYGLPLRSEHLYESSCAGTAECRAEITGADT